MRVAAFTLLDGYKTAHGGLKQVHRARPMSIFPPCAFVDAIDEGEINYTASIVQRTPLVRIRIVRGTFNAADVADANDDLVDGFIEYVVGNRHAAGGATLALITAAEDDDGWTPAWMPDDKQLPYYSTVLTLSGEGQFGALT